MSSKWEGSPVGPFGAIATSRGPFDVILMGLLLSSMIFAFVLISLDCFLDGPTIRSATGSLLSSGCLDSRLMSGELWRIATHMWLHGSPLHLLSNMVSLLALWGLCRRCFHGSAWLFIFLVSGAVAGPIQVFLQPTSLPDFSKWQGPLTAYFGEPNSPLVGASGGICGLWGALAAVALRCWFAARRGVKMPRPARTVVWWLLIPFLIQVIADAGSPGVAGGGHIAGFLCGFLLVFAPPALRPSYADWEDVVTRPAAP